MSPLLLEQFHFIRPYWLLSIIPACFLAVIFWQLKRSAVNWRGAIAPQLLEHLVDVGASRASRWPWLALLIAWIISALAMAGPAWDKLPQPVHQRQDALVIVLDLSLSMLAEDIQPSRLIRARHKVLDILNHRSEGLSALIAYSGDAHVVSPLTDDNPTVANLAPALTPSMMPVYGSDPVAALKLAKQLFTNAGISSGRVLLLTDGVTQDDVDDIGDELSSLGFQLSIMGIGTIDGAPIPFNDSFLKDGGGNIIVPQLNRSKLEKLAQQNNGRYTDITLDDSDVEFLMPTLIVGADDKTIVTEREFDQWHDRGPLLVLLILPFALLAFRRGWLFALPLVFMLQPETSHAIEWDELWQRPDQRGIEAMQQGDPAQAANYFKHEQWRASAHYQAGDYEKANVGFGQKEDPSAHYNRGNALAKSGKLDEAITAYEQALAQQPDMEDAQFNKQLIEQLKEQQEQQKDQQQSDDDSEDDGQQEQQNEDQKDKQQPGDEQQDGNEDDQQDQQNEQSEPDESDEPQDPENKDNDKEQEQEQENEDPQQQRNETAEMTPEQEQQEQQEQQAMEQWLRKIPDDPSGLLRRKFNYEYQVRQSQGATKREQPQW
ncbi:MAG: VWA domain-containing protein [Oceanicoccus sp.]